MTGLCLLLACVCSTVTFPAIVQEARQPSVHRAGERRVPAVAAFTDKQRFLPDVFSRSVSSGYWSTTGVWLQGNRHCRENPPTNGLSSDLVHTACQMLRERLRCDAALKNTINVTFPPLANRINTTQDGLQVRRRLSASPEQVT